MFLPSALERFAGNSPLIALPHFLHPPCRIGPDANDRVFYTPTEPGLASLLLTGAEIQNMDPRQNTEYSLRCAQKTPPECDAPADLPPPAIHLLQQLKEFKGINMSHTPPLSTSFLHGMEMALADAMDTSIHTTQPTAPTETGGTPQVPGASSRGVEMRSLSAHSQILKNITGKDPELAERNFNILKRRLGHNFVEIMNSPGFADAVRDVKLEYNFDIQSKQSSALLKRLVAKSLEPLPDNIRPGEFSGCPTDIMGYRVPDDDKFHATMLEMNGIGWGNVTTTEESHLQILMKAAGDVSDVLKEDPNALIIIACSGREDPPNFSASKKIHEKFMIASAALDSVKKFQEENRPELSVEEQLAQAMSDQYDDESEEEPTPIRGAQLLMLDTFDPDALQRDEHGKVIVVDSVAQEKPGRDKDGIANMMKILNETPDWHNPTRPTIISGYTSQLAKAIELRNGAMYLGDRRVAFTNNDRLPENVNSLNAEKGEKVDPKKTRINNVSFLPAASKSHAYAFINEYNNTEGAEKFPQFGREIINDRGNSIDEVFDLVVHHLTPGEETPGRRVIIKPYGTGHGDGIAAFDVPELQNKDAIRKEIEQSYAAVKGTYGDRGGFPYTVSEYLIALRVDRPGHPMHSMKFELRIGVINDTVNYDRPMLIPSPTIAKIDSGSKLAPGQSGDFSKQFASVSSQVLATGLPASEFMKPLLDPEFLDLVGISEEDLSALCQWTVGAVAYTLKNVDRADSILPNAQDELTKAQGKLVAASA